ncbi:DUF4401 domain-containing protein [Planctomycetota bacterium]
MKPLNSRGISLNEMVAHLKDRGLLDDTSQEAIKVAMAPTDAPSPVPWFIQVLLGFGAWFAGLFLIGFMAIANLLDSETSAMMWGIVLISVATGLSRILKDIFGSQLILTISVAGHIMFMVGMYEHFGEINATICSIILCAVLYGLYQNNLHRWFSCMVALIMILILIMDADANNFLHILICAQGAVAAILFANKNISRCFHPLGYALTVAMMVTIWCILLEETGLPPWPASLVLSLLLIRLYKWIMDERGAVRQDILVIAAIGTLIIGVLSNPGVPAALGLLMLGYALRNRQLLGLGFLSLPAFIIFYYYNLELTLLYKSLALSGSGAVLLLMRWFFSHRMALKESVS